MNLSQERERELERAIDVLTNHLANKSYQAVIDKGITCINEFAEVESHLHLAKINSMIGYAFYSVNSFEDSIRYFEKSILVYESLESTPWVEVMQVVNSLTSLYRLKGHYLNAFIQVKKSIDISEEHGFINSTGYNNLGTIFRNVGKLNEAMFCFQIAWDRECTNDTPNNRKILKYKNNLGGVLSELNRKKEAKRIFLDQVKEGLIIDVETKLVVLRELGSIFFEEGKVKTALFYLENARKQALDNVNLIHYSSISLKLSEVYAAVRNSRKELETLYEAYIHSKKYNYPYLESSLQNLISFYVRKGNYKKSIKFQKELLRYKHGRFNNTKFYKIQAEFDSQRLDYLLEKEYKYRKKLEKKNRRLSKLHAMNTRLNYRIELLHKQLQPVFIFNTLQDIQRMAMLGDKMAASDHIAQFATLMRLVLQYARREKIHVLESVDLLKRYLQLDISRQGKKVECTIDCGSIESDEMDFFVPPFFISSLVLDWLRQTDLPDKGEINIAIKPCKEGFELTCDINRNDLAYKLNLDEPQSAYWYDECKQAYWLSYANLEHFTASINVQANVPTQAYLALRIAG